MYVQFSDATETVVVSVFGSPQDSTAYPNLGNIAATDARYIAFVDPASTLSGAQTAQASAMTAAYQAAIQRAVNYTSKGGVTKTYQADPQSVSNLSQMLLAFQASAALPAGFYWVASDNTQVPFTYADLQALAQAFGAQGVAAFQQLQAVKKSISSASSVAAVQAIQWP